MPTQAEFEVMKEQLIAEREERQAEREAILEQQRIQQEQAFARFEALLKAETQLEVAQISAGATLQQEQIAAAEQGAEE